MVYYRVCFPFLLVITMLFKQAQPVLPSAYCICAAVCVHCFTAFSAIFPFPLQLRCQTLYICIWFYTHYYKIVLSFNWRKKSTDVKKLNVICIWTENIRSKKRSNYFLCIMHIIRQFESVVDSYQTNSKFCYENSDKILIHMRMTHTHTHDRHISHPFFRLVLPQISFSLSRFGFGFASGRLKK